MNTPNKLTVLRILLVPFYVFFLLMSSIPHHYLIATALFGAAAYTDHLDGKIARKYNMITDFGKFADPLADKVMILAALACFVQLDLTNAVILILIVSREFMVTSIRLVASAKGKVVAANNWGKAKTISQIVAVLGMMMMQYILELNSLNILHFANVDSVALWLNVAGDVLLWIATALTLISGIIYIVQNIDFIKTAK